MAVIPKPNRLERLDKYMILGQKISVGHNDFPLMENLIISEIHHNLGLEIVGSGQYASVELNLIRKETIVFEGYDLTLDLGKIQIEASSEAGVYYGIQSLIQYIVSSKSHKNSFRLQGVNISDRPAYEWRGFMLDVSRHFIPVEQVKKLIELASKMKMNRFHWHLTDDHGWRIDLDSYPDLVKNQISGPGGIQRLGYYTKSEMKEIVAFAKERMITLVPEIDMPGHILGLLAAYPQVACQPQDFQLAQGPGISQDVLCLGNDTTYSMMTKILDEILEIFPGRYVHIGGDEVPVTRWLECEKCRDKAIKNRLETPEDLKKYFLQQMVDHLNLKGKKVILWNDALMDGGLKGELLGQFWMTTEGPASLVKLEDKYTLIDSNFKHYYLDYPMDVISLKSTYTYESLFQNGLGVEGALWTEWVMDEETLHDRLLPRLMAIAESGWTTRENKSYEAFEKSLEDLGPWLMTTGFELPDKKQWNPKGPGRWAGFVGHYRRMLDLKTIGIALKMRKESRTQF